MPDQQTHIIVPRYYPKVSAILDTDDIPDILGFIKEGILYILDRIHYKDLQYNKSPRGDAAFYSLRLVSKNRLDIEIPGTGIFLVLNPDADDTTISSFPITIDYEWQILAYLRDFNLDGFDFSPQQFFEIALRVLNISEEQAIAHFINTFTVPADPDTTPIEQFAVDINEFNSGINLLTPTQETTITEIVTDIYTQSQKYATLISFSTYILKEGIEETWEHLKTFFRSLLPQDIEEYIKDILLPKARATLTLSAGIEFPRKILQPVYDVNGINPLNPTDTGEGLTVIPANEQGAPRVVLSFAEALFYADTTQGLGYQMDVVLNTNMPAMIGNTGLIIELKNLKVDLSNTQNIPEADRDGRPASFQGVYAQYAAITLPTKWFDNEENHPDTTARLAGYDLLIGNGGISGTVALEAVNPDQTAIRLIKTFGKSDGFAVWFTRFDITFKQGKVVESNIIGGLKVPLLKDANGDQAEIDIVGHLADDGDFFITASEKDGFQPIQIPQVLDIYIQSIEVGSEEGVFFLGTQCELEFTNPVMQKLFSDSPSRILLPNLRIYADGSFEIVGGTIPIPANFSLSLGPVTVAISGVNFGSHQREYGGQLRKYNFWGFDGAINVDPLGIEARGDGIKYYYTVDDGEGKPHDSYIHIRTVSVDLIIPGSATPATATAIINGYLSIPEPGVSQEYAGGISLKLPKARIAGSAEMRLIPKHPAFIVDAELSIPVPIPLGATGLSITGFRGLFGYRYVAEKEAVGLTSGNTEDTWYDYYVYPRRGINIQKFSSPEQTQNYRNPISIGAGATIETSEGGTIMSTRVMILLSIPSLFMIDGRASVLGKRQGLDSRQEPPFFAFLAFGDNSIEAGVGADFKLKERGEIISLSINIEAAFFFNNPSAWYLNIGTRQRPNEARVLNLFTAQAYLQLSAKGIETGARADFNFDKRFGPVHVKAWLYIEVGAKISFERAQFGGYIDAGGGAEASFWILTVGISFQAILSAEAIKPFKIYAAFRVCGKIKLGFIKIRKCAEVELKWEKSRQVDTTPIPPLLPERTEELVKAVHMLTGEAFDLQEISENIKGNSPNYNPITIPMDSYVDVKFTKPVKPRAIRDKLGGTNNAPKGYIDLIPPEKTVRGKDLRQVAHQYAIEALNIDIWDGQNWQNYHPYEALTIDTDANIDPLRLKIGHWQKTGKEYDKFRLLTNNPFSFTEQGERGWFIPEQVGITASSLFCEADIRRMKCADFLNRAVGARFAVGTSDPNHYFEQNELFFRVDGLPYVGSEADIKGEYAKISNEANPYGFIRSLEIHNSNSISLKFPNSVRRVNMKLSSTAQGVNFRFYSTSYSETTGEISFDLIPDSEIYRSSPQLHDEVIFESPNIGINKVVIDPQMSNQDEINRLREEIEALFELTYEESLMTEQDIIHAAVPFDKERYDQLISELEEAKSVGCNLTIPGGKGIGVMKIEDSFVVGVNVFGQGLTDDNSQGTTVPIPIDDLNDEPLPFFSYEYLHNESERLSQGYYNTLINKNNWLLTGYAYGGGHVRGVEGMCTKLDLEGNVLWSKYFYEIKGGLKWIDAADGGDETSILVGYGGVSGNNLSIVKIDASGKILWQKTIGYYTYTNEQQKEINIIRINDNQFIITSKIGIDKILLLRINGKGRIVKSKVLGTGKELQVIRSYTQLNNNTIGLAIWRRKPEETNFKSVVFQINVNSLELKKVIEFDDINFKINDIEVTTKNRCNIVGYNQIKNAIIFIENFTGNKAKKYKTNYIERDSIRGIKTVKIVENNPNLIYTNFQIIHIKNATQEELMFKSGFGYIETLVFDAEKDVHFFTQKNGTGMGQLSAGLEYCKFDKKHYNHTYQNITSVRSTIQSEDKKISLLSGLKIESAPLKIKKGAMVCPTPPPPPPPPSIKVGKCFTLLHEVCWLTEEDFEFNLNIPPIEEIQEDFEADVLATNNVVAPIWRPYSKYRLHFKLSDTVDNNAPKNFDYYFGFKTAGPIGHFHTDPDATYGDIIVNGKTVEDSVENPDVYPLTSLRNYIDYNRSYPNANGSLLQAKPLFYGTEGGNNEIAIFFTKAYVYHMFGAWGAYKNLEAQNYQLQILVKDPIEKVTFSNPPETQEEIEEIPGTTSEWTEDLIPRIPESHEFLLNLFDNQYCTPNLGEAIVPRSFAHKVTITNLKPRKMYTAIVNCIVDGDVPKTAQIHDFVFQTSRYMDFKEQVQSYYLTDDSGMTQEARFVISLDVTNPILNTAYRTVAGNPNAASIAKQTEQIDLFDRVIEGILQVPPLDAAMNTEINILKNNDTPVGLWIRNPEPFNDPKTPIEILMGANNDIQQTIAVLNTDGTINKDFKLLYSKDRSQCLLMKKEGTEVRITETTINLRFTYLRWNGNAYEVKSTEEIGNVLINA